MNRFNPEKLVLTKWTAVNPVDKQKHFLISQLIRDDDEKIIGCIIEAVLTKQFHRIDHNDLKDDRTWLQGWK